MKALHCNGLASWQKTLSKRYLHLRAGFQETQFCISVLLEVNLQLQSIIIFFLFLSHSKHYECSTEQSRGECCICVQWFWIPRPPLSYFSSVGACLAEPPLSVHLCLHMLIIHSCSVQFPHYASELWSCCLFRPGTLSSENLSRAYLEFGIKNAKKTQFLSILFGLSQVSSFPSAQKAHSIWLKFADSKMR